jgi:anti-sigma-K factor RskA
VSESGTGGAMAHHRLRDDVAAYALGSLDGVEAREIERHLAECTSCREYLGWLDPAVEMLPDSVPQLEPPKRLKRDLMAAVRADARSTERAERARARREGERRGIFGLAWRPATALAVCVIAIAGLFGGYALWGGDEDSSVVVDARPTAAGVPANAMIVTLEVEDGRGTLHVEKLPPLQQDRVYQAWIGRDGEMVPSTPFVLRRDGTTEVAIDGDLDGADGVFITREPEGGSVEPTAPVLMKAPLA